VEYVEDFPSDCFLIRDILQEYLKSNEWPFIRGRLLLEDYVCGILENRGLLTDPKTRKPKIQQQRIRLCITRAMKHLEYRLSSNSTNAYINCRSINAEEEDREEESREKEGDSLTDGAEETKEIREDSEYR
jgi:hypothetical protein